MQIQQVMIFRVDLGAASADSRLNRLRHFS